MLLILSVTYGNWDELSDFIGQCEPYVNQSYNDIPPEVADSIFNEFKRLITNYESRGEVQ